VFDIPQPLSGEDRIKIAQDSPICTIEVKADNADLALAAVQKRALALQLQLGIFNEKIA